MADDKTEAVAKAAAKMVADAEMARNPQPGPKVAAAEAASRAVPKTAAMAAAGEKTVMMSFPKRVILTLNDHSRIDFPAGICEVPESLADHKWLAQNGVKQYTGGGSTTDLSDDARIARLEAELAQLKAAVASKKPQANAA